MPVTQRYTVKTEAESSWLEVEDRRGDDAGIEFVAKQEGPPAVGDEEIFVRLSTEDAQELAHILDVILNRHGMVIETHE